jgi:SagB-type dehydrogenase family enzyme
VLPPSAVHRYHDGTKHHFHQFARSLGYLDWASQPNPFRHFAGAPVLALARPAAAAGPTDVASRTTYDRVFDPPVAGPALSAGAIGDLLRHALGLSAWKRFRDSRWALRVNPSSGNLHPTEAYLVCGPLEGLADSAAVYHYVADEHALEMRCAFDAAAWSAACGPATHLALVAITSIHWREAWKYGERAFRYCQHDLGHAVAALALSAAAIGWRTRLLASWSHANIAAITGAARNDDFVEAEREEPGCLLAIGSGTPPEPFASLGADLVAAVRAGTWRGRANQLSEDHVQWTFIDDIAIATEDPGSAVLSPERPAAAPNRAPIGRATMPRDARTLILGRRSALAFDGRSSIDRDRFFDILSRVMPAAGAPWNALWWTPRIHLAIFVHRVDEMAPGLYLLPRDARALPALRAACRRDFLWEPSSHADAVPLVCLARGAYGPLAARLSCDQSIAADGFFSLGMIAEFDASLEEHGPAFYRHLFWESGVVGQVLYLEAEAAGARATGIGCFYDDPVHEALGLENHAFQSLYHFSMGMPVEDTRLSTEPGYAWERGPSS